MGLADRYLRTGTDIPAIYPGELAHLRQAMKDAQAASARGGRHHVLGQWGTETRVLQVYENGQCTWYTRRES